MPPTTFIAVADRGGLRQLYPTSELSAGIAPLALQALTSPAGTVVAEVRIEKSQADLVLACLTRQRRRTALRMIHDYTHRKAHMIVGTLAQWCEPISIVN